MKEIQMLITELVLSDVLIVETFKQITFGREHIAELYTVNAGFVDVTSFSFKDELLGGLKKLKDKSIRYGCRGMLILSDTEEYG